jgi:hypothetical protein
LREVNAPYESYGDNDDSPDQSCLPFNGVHPRPLPNVC